MYSASFRDDRFQRMMIRDIRITLALLPMGVAGYSREAQGQERFRIFMLASLS